MNGEVWRTNIMIRRKREEGDELLYNVMITHSTDGIRKPRKVQ